jgi:asparagine synthase (glutamine-hydrolysing)
VCGIAGFFTPSGGNEDAMRAAATAMAERLRHRGPDGDGVFVDAAAGIAFGFRRLAIIDLSAAGAQPMESAGGRYVIAFNGEVYNAPELRKRLESEGDAPQFRGHSDTEVMLACIEAWGVRQAVDQFLGMFAFALWDRRERALFLVRDRAGVKPLYVATAGETITFASELRAMDVARSIDDEAAKDYFALGYVPGPRSIFRDVQKLEPGTILRVDRNGTRSETYWDPRAVFARVAGSFRGSDRDAVDAVDALVADSVRLRMVADVPLGVFLSGGIDSSLVTALMQRQSPAPIRTFSIGFDDPSLDEAPFAREVARALGTQHHELYLSESDVLAAVPRMAEIYDEPFADTSQIPTYLVSRMSRGEVTVALTGDGGDELFGGYHHHFLGQQLRDRAARVPKSMQRPLGRLLQKLPGRRARSYSEVLAGGAENIDTKMLHDFVSYLRDDILVKVDRASMAVSLECREPLLDHRLVELAWSLPLRMKVRDGGGKWVLKQVLERYVPRALFAREKAGFGAPIAAWLRGPLREWAESLLADEDDDAVRRAWSEHLGGADRGGEIWRALMFRAWLRNQ